MKREIKFRAWDNEEKKMLTWKVLSDWCNPDGATQIGLILNGDVLGKILMQFTGLKDKNGKEIYEGDIAKCATYVSMFSDDKALELPYEVYFDQGQWRIGGAALYAWNDKAEVIGNIYENKELLK